MNNSLCSNGTHILHGKRKLEVHTLHWHPMPPRSVCPGRAVTWLLSFYISKCILEYLQQLNPKTVLSVLEPLSKQIIVLSFFTLSFCFKWLLSSQKDSKLEKNSFKLLDLILYIHHSSFVLLKKCVGIQNFSFDHDIGA